MCVQTDSNSNKAESGHMLITVYLEMLDVKYSNTLKLRNLWFHSQNQIETDLCLPNQCVHKDLN